MVVWFGIGLAVGTPLAVPYLVQLAVMTGLVVWMDRGRPFSTSTLVGLLVWLNMHEAGGIVQVGDDSLYFTWIVPWLRWDHLVHMVGYAFAGLAAAEALERWVPNPKPALAAWMVFLGGTAVGSATEVVEWIVDYTISFADVGDVVNTKLDLVANTVGALAAAEYRRRRVSI